MGTEKTKPDVGISKVNAGKCCGAMGAPIGGAAAAQTPYSIAMASQGPTLKELSARIADLEAKLYSETTYDIQVTHMPGINIYDQISVTAAIRAITKHLNISIERKHSEIKIVAKKYPWWARLVDKVI